MGGLAAEFRLVVAPETGFATIAGAMSAAGLRPGPDDAVTPPAIPGEREFAYWTAPEDGSRVHYSFNPAVFLRVLVFSGRSAIRWHTVLSSALTLLGQREIATLLQSSSRREVLLGLYAAAELRAVGLIAAVGALRVGPDRRVSQTAAEVAEKLTLALVSAGAERLADAQRRHPDRAAVFAHLGDEAARREILLWLLRDGHGGSPDTVKVLRSGLADPGWRVRVTAMLVAARLKLPALWQDVRQMELPAASRSGLDANKRSLLKAARKAVLSELASEPVPEDDSARARLTRDLRHAVAGRAGAERSEAGDWVREWLSTPGD